MSGGHSWIGTNAETALLYGTLSAAMLFLKSEDTDKQFAEALYQAEIARLKVRYSGRNRLEERRHDNLIVPVQ